MHRTFLERRRIVLLNAFATIIQKVSRGFLTRLKTNVAQREARLFKQRMQELHAAYSAAAIIVQKYARRFVVTRALALMRDLVALRKFLHRRDVDAVRDILNLNL